MLNLYRRHQKACAGGHPADSRSGEFEERKKGWKRCACLIYVSGTLCGRFERKRTGRSDWADARAIAAEWEHTNRWDDAPPLPKPTPPTETDSRKPIADAIKSFLLEYKDAAVSTQKNYR